MCGLAAVIDPFMGDADRSAFRDLLIITALRGLDSTGFFGVETPTVAQDAEAIAETQVRWAKALGNPYQLMGKPEFNRTMRSLNGFQHRAMVGHCRAATKGHTSPENAHPFDVGDIVGVHNGTISSGLTIPEGETDSQALYELIQKEGLGCLKEIVGAWALIWYDRRDHTINAVRNNERPLFYAETAASLMLSSESAFIDLVADRNPTYSQMKSKAKSLPSYHHLVVNLTTNKIGSYAGTEPKHFTLTDRTEELKKPAVVYHYGGRFRGEEGYGVYGYADDYYGVDGYRFGGARQQTPVKTGTESPPALNRPRTTGGEKDSPVILGLSDGGKSAELFPCVPIGGGVYVTPKRHKELLKMGCSFCCSEPKATDPVVWGEAFEEGRHMAYDRFLCEDCADGKSDKDKDVINEYCGFNAAPALGLSRRNSIRFN